MREQPFITNKVTKLPKRMYSNTLKKILRITWIN